jgi:hypothetical protein
MSDALVGVEGLVAAELLQEPVPYSGGRIDPIE